MAASTYCSLGSGMHVSRIRPELCKLGGGTKCESDRFSRPIASLMVYHTISFWALQKVGLFGDAAHEATDALCRWTTARHRSVPFNVLQKTRDGSPHGVGERYRRQISRTDVRMVSPSLIYGSACQYIVLPQLVRADLSKQLVRTLQILPSSMRLTPRTVSGAFGGR